MRACAADSESGLLISVYQNVGQSIIQNKFKKLVTWFGVRPSILVAMGNDQTTLFGGFLESLVVVSVASTAILNAIDVVEIMNHFVEKRCHHIFDWSCERSCTDVDFVCAAQLGNPSVAIQGEVPIRLGGALDGDGRS